MKYLTKEWKRRFEILLSSPPSVNNVKRLKEMKHRAEMARLETARAASNLPKEVRFEELKERNIKSITFNKGKMTFAFEESEIHIDNPLIIYTDKDIRIICKERVVIKELELFYKNKATYELHLLLERETIEEKKRIYLTVEGTNIYAIN